jgi:hypothetical protein
MPTMRKGFDLVERFGGAVYPGDTRRPAISHTIAPASASISWQRASVSIS